MEAIPNYDNWKTTPPDDPKPVAYCSLCGEPLYEGDGILDVLGDMWCEKCIDDNRRFL